MIEIMKKDSLKKGLSGEQAAKSKAEFGTNELAKKQPESLLSMFIGAFDDIWIKVLCFALLLKIVLAVLGVIFPAISGGNDAIEIVSIILAIALATGFSTLSEYRNSSRSEALQEEYSKTFAKVMRDGKLLKISTNEIVKGDTILIQAGDKVPVDGLIFDGHVKVSQAALNGESRDESKVAADNMDDAESTDYSSENKVFMGSVVTSGEAYMVATVIGDASELGKNIVVQGGTFYNDAVLRSFEKIANCQAIRPDIAGIMGAFGAALIAREHYEDGYVTTMLDYQKICDIAAAPHFTYRDKDVFDMAFLEWDNTARYREKATIYKGCTPPIFEKNFRRLVQKAEQKPEGRRFVYINAWNEWAEGTYLEPDEKNGYGYLEAVQRVMRERTQD